MYALFFPVVYNLVSAVSYELRLVPFRLSVCLCINVFISFLSFSSLSRNIWGPPNFSLCYFVLKLFPWKTTEISVYLFILSASEFRESAQPFENQSNYDGCLDLLETVITIRIRKAAKTASWAITSFLYLHLFCKIVFLLALEHLTYLLKFKNKNSHFSWINFYLTLFLTRVKSLYCFEILIFNVWDHILEG